MSFKKKAAVALATIAVAGTVSVQSASPASALITSDHLVISGHSCGGSAGGVKWVAYAGGTSSGSRDGVNNQFIFDIYGVKPPWEGNTPLSIGIKCNNGSYHDWDGWVTRSWDIGINKDLGWI